MRKLIVLAMLLASIGTVGACPPPRKTAVIVQQAVVTPVVAAVVTQAVLVPTYTAAYQPAAQVVQSDPALIAELKALRQEVANLRASPASPATPTAEQPVTFAALVANKCASCHRADNADKLGGGFVLSETNGKLTELSLPEKRHIIDRVVTKANMPPVKTGVVLSAAEKASTAELSAQK